MAIIRSNVRVRTGWLAVIDLMCLLIGSAMGIYSRFDPGDLGLYVYGHLEGWLLLYAGVIFANYLAGSYLMQYTFSRFNLVVTWLFSLIFALLIVSITSYAWLAFVIGRGVLLYTITFYSIMSLFLKLLVYRKLFQSNVFVCRTAIIGTGRRARMLRSIVESEFVLPAHKVVAFINIDGKKASADAREGCISGVVVVDGTSPDIEAIISNLGVNLIIIGLEQASDAREFYPQLKRMYFAGVEVLPAISAVEIYTGRTPLDMVNEEYLVQANINSRLPMIKRFKRAADMVVSFIACIVFLPVIALVAVVLKISAPHDPVFYKQWRTGQFGRIFRIYKFRTMQPNAEEGTGPVWARDGDNRITRTGKVLRRFRLDEIPQFFNVMKGDMSIVGPRPERPEIVRELEKKIPFFEERKNIMPGLTGWAQIRYPYAGSIEEVARKLEYDLYYMTHLSLSLDLQIILSTLRIMVQGKEREM